MTTPTPCSAAETDPAASCFFNALLRETVTWRLATTRQGEAADGGSPAYAASPLRAPRSAPVTGTAASTGDQQQPSRVAYDALAASNDHLRRELAALRRTQQAQARQWRRNFNELRQRYESAVGAYGTVMPAPAAVRDSV